MLRLAALLLSIVSYLQTAGLAAEEVKLTSDQKVANGVLHSAKGEKKEALAILLPEAKAGNTNAMVHLGQLMMKWPEYPNHLENAKKLFSKAAERGHKGALAMLKMVQEQEALMSPNSARKIAGRNALPTPEDIEKARAYRSEFEQNIGRYLSPSQSNQSATIHVFITDQMQFAESIAAQEPSINSRYGNQTKFKYYVIINRKTWRPGNTFIGQTNQANMIGFEPDMDGQIARSFGLRNTPSIILELASGTKKQITAQALNTELAGALR